jgi:hypothetical protein
MLNVTPMSPLSLKIFNSDFKSCIDFLGHKEVMGFPVSITLLYGGCLMFGVDDAKLSSSSFFLDFFFFFFFFFFFLFFFFLTCIYIHKGSPVRIIDPGLLTPPHLNLKTSMAWDQRSTNETCQVRTYNLKYTILTNDFVYLILRFRI